QAPHRRYRRYRDSRDSRVCGSGHHLGEPTTKPNGHGPAVTGSVALVFSGVLMSSRTRRTPGRRSIRQMADEINDQEAEEQDMSTASCCETDLLVVPCHVGDPDL